MTPKQDARSPEAAAAEAAVSSEADAVRARYARRDAVGAHYQLANPAALLAMQERQRALVALLREVGRGDFAALTLLEVGSGGGGNLLELIHLGFTPSNLAGIELLAERHAAARARLPADVHLDCGDATAWPLEAASVDVVLQSTVFSSLLDAAYQQRLADAMWRAVKPGGGILWYDFTVDNPRNADVRGVGRACVRALFPEARARFRRVTLAPPLARAVTSLHPALYTACNALPFLRTHVLGWLAKPS
ncbi:MAG: class I SAM-dependent methyltransferase [Pseudomonadota bacterium]|nr:class I SAM-dependent methyltransferase [Pseudomonadota bacterium]